MCVNPHSTYMNTSYQCLLGFQSSEQVEERSVLFQFCWHLFPNGLSCLVRPSTCDFEPRQLHHVAYWYCHAKETSQILHRRSARLKTAQARACTNWEIFWISCFATLGHADADIWKHFQLWTQSHAYAWHIAATALSCTLLSHKIQATSLGGFAMTRTVQTIQAFRPIPLVLHAVTSVLEKESMPNFTWGSPPWVAWT